MAIDYNYKHSSIESDLDCLSKSIDSLSSEYDNVILLGDFYSCMDDSLMKTFCEIYKIRNLIKEANVLKTQRILHALI